MKKLLLMLREKTAIVVATFFYVGYIPKMPGTFGSLAALPFLWYLYLLPFYFAIFILVIFIFLGIWAADYYSRLSNTHDNQKIVIDEVLGMGIALIFVAHNYLHYTIAFLLFRFFDIFKPFPIAFVDKHVKGGFGVVLDDLLAGLYVFLAFLLYYFYFSNFPSREYGVIFHV